MSVFKNGKIYHYEFKLDGRRHRGSAGTASKPQAIAEERRQRERLQKSYSQIIEEESQEQQRKTIQIAACRKCQKVEMYSSCQRKLRGVWKGCVTLT